MVYFMGGIILGLFAAVGMFIYSNKALGLKGQKYMKKKAGLP